MTSPPPTAPPPTTPPPPPPPATTFGAIDINAVRSFSDANHVDAAVSPLVATGTPPCPANTPSGTDGGDNTVSDVTEWDLMRSCDGRLRLRMPIDDGLFDLFWMEIDSGPGGCRGIDFVALGYAVQGGVEAGLVATPGCASSQWRWVDDVSWPLWNEYWLELHFRIPPGMGQSITWQAFARGRGEGPAGRDAVPDTPHTFSFA